MLHCTAVCRGKEKEERRRVFIGDRKAITPLFTVERSQKRTPLTVHQKWRRHCRARKGKIAGEGLGASILSTLKRE